MSEHSFIPPHIPHFNPEQMTSMEIKEIPNRYIVRYKKGVDEKKDYVDKKFEKRNIKRTNYRRGKRGEKILHKSKFHMVEVEDVKDIIELEKDSDIQLVSPDRHFFAQALPNDIHLPKQWALHNTGALGMEEGVDIDAEDMWSIRKSVKNNVIVAVCDTGVNYNHPDLSGNMWNNPNPSFNDIHGASFTPEGISGNCLPAWHEGKGYQWHGTHVAGIIGAVGNNLIGISGVAQSCRLMALQVFYFLYISQDIQGWTLRESDALLSWEYAADHGARVINNSWGGMGDVSEAMFQSFIDLYESNIMVICAAGNNELGGKNNDIWGYAPSGTQVNNNVAVSSVGAFGELAWYSNYGLKSVECAAPGGSGLEEPEYSILSTVSLKNDATGAITHDYGYAAGTSMAAPMIAGITALSISEEELPHPLRMQYVLRGSIKPRTGLFLTTTYGGYISGEQVLRNCKNYLPQVKRISLVPDLDDGTKFNIEWENPDEPSFNKVIIDYAEWCFPGSDEEGVTTHRLYTGPDETCVHEDIDPNVVYGYKFTAVYADGSISIPVYYRGQLQTEFYCPDPPGPWDFRCDYWDEEWPEVFEFPLLQMNLMPMFWRCISSKRRTKSQRQIYPASLFGFYQRETPPEEMDGIYDFHIGTVPVLSDLLIEQSPKEVAIYIGQLVDETRSLLQPIELYSHKFEKVMCWQWMDYYHYIQSRECRPYYPPKTFYEISWEDCKLKENWHTILWIVREVLNNLRVLYTGEPPYQFWQPYSESFSATSSNQLRIGDEKIIPVAYDIVVANASSQVDLPDDNGVIYNTDGYTSDIYKEGQGNPYMTDGGDIKNEDGELLHKMFNYEFPTMKVFQPAEFDAGMYIVYDDFEPYVTTYGPYNRYQYKKNCWYTDWFMNPPGFNGMGQLADNPTVAVWTEGPTDLGLGGSIPLGTRFNFELDKPTYGTQSLVRKQHRAILSAPEGELQCLSATWDWEENPVDFNVFVRIAGARGLGEVGNNIADSGSLNAIPDIFPYDDYQGYLTYHYKTPAGDGFVTANPVQMFHTGPYIEHIGIFTVDDNAHLIWEFESWIENLGLDSIPGTGLVKVHNNFAHFATGWWNNGNQNYIVANESRWEFEPWVGGGKRQEHTYTDKYILCRSTSLVCQIIVTPNFDMCDEVGPVRIPDLKGLTYNTDEIVDVLEEKEMALGNPINTDYWEPKSFECVVHQSPPPGMIYAKFPGETEDDKKPVDYTWNSTENHFIVPEDYRNFVVPKVTGMTYEDANKYLALNHPGWGLLGKLYERLPDGSYLIADSCRYVFTNDFEPGIIVSQNPSWEIRSVVNSKNIRVAIAAGPTDGLMMPDLIGMNIDDLDNIILPIHHEIVPISNVNVPSGTVVATVPGPLELIHELTTPQAYICVALGGFTNNPYKLWPNVIGYTKTQAAKVLPETNIITVGENPSRYRKGQIISQLPHYGITGEIFPMDTMYVTISSGPPKNDDRASTRVKR